MVMKKGQFLQHIEKHLLANPDWYGEVSQLLHSVAQKITVSKLKTNKERLEAEPARRSLPKPATLPVKDEKPAEAPKKKTLLEHYNDRQKKAQTP